MQLVAWDASYMEEDARAASSKAHIHVYKVTWSGKMHLAYYLQARALHVLNANTLFNMASRAHCRPSHFNSHDVAQSLR